MSFSTSSPHPISAPAIDLAERKIAYFSMEIALSKSLPTYSGGLGMLAGDTLRSAADTGAPMVVISLVHRRGYFQQHLDAAGQQTESDVVWFPETTLPSAGQEIVLIMQNREVKVRAWRFDVVGVTGHIIPVFLLDTDVEGNDLWDRRLTDHLYGGDTYYRLCQETILGLGGVQLLHALGCQPEVCHMNEGHAALLTIGLLEERLNGVPLRDATEADAEAIRQQCVFTTHTPVPAGHDKFGLDQMFAVLGHERASAIERFDEHDVPCAALLPLCQRCRHATRQGLAAYVPRIQGACHHQWRTRGDVALATLPAVAGQGSPRVAPR